MARNDSPTTLLAWGLASRIVVVGLLFLSGLQLLAAAILYRELGVSEDDSFIAAGSLVVAGIAFALGLAFWKSGAPTWKHKVAVAVVAFPALASLVVH